MKTVGHILHNARLEKKLTPDQLSSLTKIDTKYILALEEDDYDHLPSETFAKGFIRNLSLRLDRNPEELVAVFRRDFRQPYLRTQKTPIRHRRFVLPQLLSSQFLFIGIGALFFFTYLIFQFRAIITPPPLSIARPTAGSVMVSPIEVEGLTAVDATISINDDTKLKPDQSGHFLGRLNLPVGETVLEIKSTNRFSRSSTQKIKLTIVSQ